MGKGTTWVAVAAILIASAAAQAQDLPLTPASVSGSFGKLGVRKYINSFTSYEFPNPENGAQDPLSRLEWPWEQNYAVITLGWLGEPLELNFEYATTLTLLSKLRAQDSDWEDPANPTQKTTFSEGKAKPRGWTFDGNAAMRLPLVTGLPALKVIVGYRAQQFRFTYTDVLQGSIFDPGSGYIPTVYEFLPGAVIEFSEYYKHYYAGAIVSLDRNLPLPLGGGAARLQVKVQGDYGYVRANNEDFHVLRTPGPRFTMERTTGGSWHLGLAVAVDVGGRFKIAIDGDIIRIRCSGDHNLTEPNVNDTWRGARVWSEQKYLTATASWYF